MNDTVQLVSVSENHQHISVSIPDETRLERLSFLYRFALRMGVWLVLRAEHQRLRDERDREMLVFRHRAQREAERAKLEQERRLAIPGLHRRMF